MTQHSWEEPLAPQPSSERTFGRYRLAYQLASGGMGTVYLARAEGPVGFEKMVALKRIHPHMASDPRFVSMFLDEARIAARIHHPNVCSVIDFGEVDGSYYLTMPFILGETMNRVIGTAARLEGGPLLDVLPLMAARMVADACEGLHAAHELRDDQGRYLDVVHRDVSPHNLMVGYDGVVRVLDFGVASAKHRHYQTATGEVKGKFAYLAPEQIEAQPVDRRTDVWALGVVLWESVTARRLFARDSMAATIRAVSEMPIPTLQSLRPNAPEALDAVVAKALSRDPAGRYSDARAMGRDLQQILAKSERFVAAPDLAEWMEKLLPQGLRTQERLVEATRTGQLTDATPPPVTPELDRSVVQRRSVDAAGDTAVLGGDGTPSTVLLDRARPGRGSSPRRSVLALAAAGLGLLAVVGLGAVAGMSWMTESSPDVAPDGAAEATSTDGAEAAGPTRAEAARAAPAAIVSPSGPSAPAAPVAENPEPAVDSTAPPAAEVPPRDESASSSDDAAGSGREPEHARTARPQGTGTLTVMTPGGWALVYLGRRQLGEAPGVFTVPAGAQVVGIQPFGRGRTITRRVVVPRAGTARVSIRVGS